MEKHRKDFLDHVHNKVKGWEYILIKEEQYTLPGEYYIGIYEVYPGLFWTDTEVIVQGDEQGLRDVLEEIKNKLDLGLIYTKQELIDYRKKVND